MQISGLSFATRRDSPDASIPIDFADACFVLAAKAEGIRVDRQRRPDDRRYRLRAIVPYTGDTTHLFRTLVLPKCGLSGRDSAERYGAAVRRARALSTTAVRSSRSDGDQTEP